MFPGGKKIRRIFALDYSPPVLAAIRKAVPYGGSVRGNALHFLLRSEISGETLTRAHYEALQGPACGIGIWPCRNASNLGYGWAAHPPAAELETRSPSQACPTLQCSVSKSQETASRFQRCRTAVKLCNFTIDVQVKAVRIEGNVRLADPGWADATGGDG